jgi:HTH-type transcriptional regulator/antitoxin HigA
MTHTLIKSEIDYKKALDRLEELIDSTPETQEYDELELLGFLIEKYEDQHYPILPVDPIDAIRFRMEQMNLDQKDLVGIFGTPSKVSEVLNKKRKLSLAMIRKLYEQLMIPLDVLVGVSKIAH